MENGKLWNSTFFLFRFLIPISKSHQLPKYKMEAGATSKSEWEILVTRKTGWLWNSHISRRKRHQILKLHRVDLKIRRCTSSKNFTSLKCSIQTFLEVHMNFKFSSIDLYCPKNILFDGEHFCHSQVTMKGRRGHWQRKVVFTRKEQVGARWIVL